MKGEFKPGDLVQLKCGGPAMVVRELGRDGRAVCVWVGKDFHTRADWFVPVTPKAY